MKDPLSSQPTPYEILELDRDAGPGDIVRAFKLGLGRGIKVPKLTGAKVILESPVDRAILDLFHYDPAVMARLDPDPRGDPGALELPRRAQTAAAWEDKLRSSFPDDGVAHALAVLWYWWATHESNRLTEQASPGSVTSDPSCDVLWRNAIGCWGMVITGPDYWQGQTYVPSEIVSEVESTVSHRLTTDLHHFAQHHRDAGDRELGEMYHQLELALSTEIKTAKALLKGRFGGGQRSYSCGALMLERIGLLEKVRKQVDADLARKPDDSELRSLAVAISPHAEIATLIDRKDAGAAIDAIDKLPEKARGSAGVRALELRALLERGRQAESLDQTEEALDYWERALSVATSDEERRPVHEELVETCHRRAAALQTKRRDDAISLLEKAIRIVKSKKLEQTLAELLANRGIKTVVDAQKKAERDAEQGRAGGIPALEKALKKGLKDLKRASKLGSKKAKQQAEVAQSLLAAIGIQGVLAAAQRAASREEWGEAISLLRGALQEGSQSSEASKVVRKNLSACLTAKAVSVTNKEMKEIEDFMQKPSMSPPDLKRAAATLEDARKDLQEATELDSENRHARENLRSLEGLLQRLTPAAQLAPVGKPRPVQRKKPVRRRAPAVGSLFRAQDRAWAHSMVVGLLLIGAIVATLSATPMLWGAGSFEWFSEIRDSSAVGSVAIWTGYVLGLPTIAAVILYGVGRWQRPADYLLGVVCAQRWWKKDLFAKAVEISLYSFIVLFVSAAAIRYRQQAPVAEVIVSEAEPEAVTQTGASADATQMEQSEAPPLPAIEATPEEITTELVAETPTVVETAPAVAPDIDVLVDLSWVAMDTIPSENVTAVLESLSNLGQEEVQSYAARLTAALPDASETGRAAVVLASAFAEERMGDVTAAEEAYHSLIAFAAQTTHARTAQLRLEVLDAATEDALEDAYRAIAAQPGSDVWARVNGHWALTTTDRAALHGLMELRSERPSIRLFSYLRSKSVFPLEYAYLFIFLIIGLAVKVLQFPLHSKLARLSLAVPKLRPEIRRIRRLHSKNTAAMNKKVAEAYRKYGASPAAGCLKALIDLVLIIWIFVAFGSYVPQLRLDGAQFLWVASVADRDLGVLAAWFFTGILMAQISPRLSEANTAQLLAGTGVWLGVVAAVAWFWSWPAYLFVFFTLLWVITAILHFVMIGFHASRA